MQALCTAARRQMEENLELSNRAPVSKENSYLSLPPRGALRDIARGQMEEDLELSDGASVSRGNVYLPPVFVPGPDGKDMINPAAQRAAQLEALPSGVFAYIDAENESGRLPLMTEVQERVFGDFAGSVAHVAGVGKGVWIPSAEELEGLGPERIEELDRIRRDDACAYACAVDHLLERYAANGGRLALVWDGDAIDKDNNFTQVIV